MEKPSIDPEFVPVLYRLQGELQNHRAVVAELKMQPDRTGVALAEVQGEVVDVVGKSAGMERAMKWLMLRNMPSFEASVCAGWAQGCRRCELKSAFR